MKDRYRNDMEIKMDSILYEYLNTAGALAFAVDGVLSREAREALAQGAPRVYDAWSDILCLDTQYYGASLSFTSEFIPMMIDRYWRGDRWKEIPGTALQLIVQLDNMVDMVHPEHVQKYIDVNKCKEDN
jgi:hypothetical protein